jgi:hypothetical protein
VEPAEDGADIDAILDGTPVSQQTVTLVSG